MKIEESINTLNSAIDVVDRKIVDLISERLSYAKIISKLKQSNNLPIEDINRENEVLNRVAQQSQLSPYITEDFIKNLFKQIMDFTKD